MVRSTGAIDGRLCQTSACAGKAGRALAVPAELLYPARAMPGWKDLLQRAKQLASEHLPEEVKDAGRRWLGDAPAPTSAPRETTTAVASIPKPAPAEDYAEKRAAEALARL